MYILNALKTVNFDSLNVACIVLYAIVVFITGRLSVKHRTAYIIVALFVIAVLYLFIKYDWS